MTKHLHPAKPTKVIALIAVALFCFLSGEVFAQNTKGDKPASGQKSIFRLPKLKSKKKGGDKAYTRDISGRRRIRTKNKSSARRAIEVVAPINANRKPKGDKFVKAQTSSVGNSPRSGDRSYKQPGGGNRKIRSSSASRSRNNVYPNDYRFVSNPSPRPRNNQRAYSNRKALSKAASMRTKPRPTGSKRTVGGRTASRSFVTRGRKNVYWGKFRKGERPVTTDITGRTLRTKNFHTPGIGVIPAQEVYKVRRKKPGDQPFRGTFGNRFTSRSRKEKSWRGNVSGNALRSNPPKNNQVAGRFFDPRKLSISGKNGRGKLRGSGYSSRSSSGRIQKAIPVKAPGLGASGFQRFLGKFTGKKTLTGGQSASQGFRRSKPINGKSAGRGARFVARYQGFMKGRKTLSLNGYYYSGDLKGQKPLKGGGSVSGRKRNNGGQPVQVKGPGIGGRVDLFQGNSKGQRPLKGGGSISGRGRNNGGQPVQVKGPGIGGRFVDLYKGNIKSQRPLKGGGSISGRARNNGGQPVQVKGPGIGGRFADIYQGNIKSQRPLKGGGSISGRSRNNGGQPVQVKGPGIGGRFADIYKGNIKAQRPLKGGGSISGRSRNNGGQPIQVKGPGIGGRFADIYQGNIKAQRPLKGGGSISGRSRNNGGQPVQVKGPGIGGRFADIYQGNIKAQRPLKGGGSISGRSRNNGGQPVQVKGPGIGGRFADIYQGNIKTQRPLKGGGSISGRPRNNGGQPVLVKGPGAGSRFVDVYQGTMKATRPLKGGGSVSRNLWNNNNKPIQGKSYAPSAMKVGTSTGDKKQKNYVHNPNSKEGALKKQAPGKSVYAVGGLQIKTKSTGYERNKNSHEDALKKQSPGKSTYAVGGLQIKAKSARYVRNENANENALKKLSPGKSVYAVGGLQIRTKAKTYEHNKKSSKDALKGESAGKNSLKAIEYSSRIQVLWKKTFEKGNLFAGRIPMKKYVHSPTAKKGALMVMAPGKANARMKDFQGNMKMSKPHGNNLHPDAQFAHSFRDNVKGERTFLMNLKLKWAKLFRKNSTQPASVKERQHRPRYDKKERELWKDLYD